MTRAFPNWDKRAFPIPEGIRDFPTGGNEYVDPAADPFFNQVIALLHMEGLDGGSTFLDDSTYAHTVTRAGNTNTDTAQFKFGTSSALFDGTLDDLDFPDGAETVFGSSDFTIECWVRFNGDPTTGVHAFVSHYNNGSSQRSWFLRLNNNQLDFAYYTNGVSIAGNLLEAWNPAGDTWYNVTIVRDGTTIHGYIDGVELGTGLAVATDVLFNSNEEIRIGAIWSSGLINEMNGWIDELRITIGVARYTANFTPAGGQFPDF